MEYLYEKKIYLVALFFPFLVVGCKKPHPNPEALDPIYKDLSEQRARKKISMGKIETDIVRLKKDIEDTHPRSSQRKILGEYLKDAEQQLRNVKQMERYYKIKALKRKKFVYRDYTKAFNKDEPWPNPEEYSRYKTYKKLRNAPRNWDLRVPKPKRFITNNPLKDQEARQESIKKISVQKKAE